MYNNLIGTASVLHTLLPQHAFEVEIRGEKTVIKASPELIKKIKAELQRKLSSSEAFLGSLPGRKAGTSTSTFSHPDVEEKPPQTRKEAELRLLNMLGEEAFDAAGFSFKKLFNDAAKFVGGVLFSKPTSKKNIREIWEQATEEMLTYFKDKDIESLRRSWRGESSPLSTSACDLDEPDTAEIASSLIQQCFGVQRQGDQAVMYIDVQKLYHFLFPPLIQEDLGEVIPDSRHLVDHAKQLSREGVIFRITHSDAKLKNSGVDYIVEPILICEKKGQFESRYYTLDIDSSGSMMGYFSNLKTHVKDFIQRLRASDPEARIKINFFASSTKFSQEFSSKSSLAEILNFIDPVTAEGGTRLFGTVIDSLKAVGQAPDKMQTKYINILFTDGRNEAAIDTENMSQVKEYMQQLQTQGISLKYFTIGFGDCDAVTLNELAAEGGDAYIQLESMKSFEPVLEYLDKMTAKKVDFKLVVHHLQQDDTFTLQQYFTGGFQPSYIRIPMQKGEPLTISINGDELVIVDPQNMCAEDALDMINKLLIDAREVITRDDLTMVDKISQIDHIHSVVSAMSDSVEFEPQKNYIDAGLKEVENLRNQFKKTIGNQQASMSLKSRITMQQAVKQSSPNIIRDPIEQIHTSSAARSYSSFFSSGARYLLDTKDFARDSIGDFLNTCISRLDDPYTQNWILATAVTALITYISPGQNNNSYLPVSSSRENFLLPSP